MTTSTVGILANVEKSNGTLNATSKDSVYTVPANRYARVTVFWSPFSGSGNVTIAGRQFLRTGEGSQEIWLGSGQSVSAQNGSGTISVSVIGVLMSNGMIP